MTRRVLLLAALAAALAPPAVAQDRPTDEEVREMEDRVESLREDSVAARRAFNDLPDGPDRLAARDTAETKIDQINVYLESAREDLATARSRVEDAEADGADEEAGDETERTIGADGVEAAPPDPGPSGAENDSEDSAPWYTSWPVLGLGAALLALAGASAWWFTQRRDAHRPRSTIADQQRVGLEQSILAQTVQRSQFETLVRQVQQQKKEVDDLRAWMTDFYATTQPRAAPAAPAPVALAPEPVALVPADAAAASFADWCRRATPMMSKVDFFANHLLTNVPGASVQPLYRDLNSQAEPVRFDGRGGASPAEFWLVTVGSEALLFPQPLNAHQFRDLTRVFDGAATPTVLSAVVPARVRDEGGAYALVQPGRVA